MLLVFLTDDSDINVKNKGTLIHCFRQWERFANLTKYLNAYVSIIVVGAGK